MTNHSPTDDIDGRCQAAPVSTSQRIASIDVLRGFALLGILPINILSLALPGLAFLNPTLAGGFAGRNRVAWILCYALFDEKMMTIFSMLFGASLLLMTDRIQNEKASPAAYFYRRTGILLLIGIAHAYLLWAGDILVIYAICGMLVYPLRKLPPGYLLILGLLVILPSVWLARSEAAYLADARDAAGRVQSAEEHGQTPSDADLALSREWNAVRSAFHPTADALAENIDERRQGSYWQLALGRAPNAFFVETTLFWQTFLWTVVGRMLIGMGLMKLGVFSAERSHKFYRNLAVLGFSCGLPLVALSAYRLIENNFDVIYLVSGAVAYNEFGSLLFGFGYVGFVVAIFKAGLMTGLTSRLAAVGRMALSNYLLQTVICTTLFNGYGFGLFGQFDRIQLLGVVVAVWALQVWYSPLWLRHFRFGPVEWVWRSLTYGKAQQVWNAP